MRLKPLSEQVAVVLGASSGIGRESALRLAARGASVVAASRGEPDLQSLVREITERGGRATYVVCDAVDPAQVTAVADAAVATYGRVDTWVNVAGVISHSPFDETEPEDFRRLMEVNYLGHVHGARAALPRLREAGGGALVFVTSAEAAVAMPGHSAYAASKHAVEGLVAALRRELLAESVPVSVTSVRPSSTNTPIFSHASHHAGINPEAPSPIYPTSVAADCVVHAAEHPVRVLWAGGSGRAAPGSSQNHATELSRTGGLTSGRRYSPGDRVKRDFAVAAFTSSTRRRWSSQSSTMVRHSSASSRSSIPDSTPRVSHIICCPRTAAASASNSACVISPSRLRVKLSGLRRPATAATPETTWRTVLIS